MKKGTAFLVLICLIFGAALKGQESKRKTGVSKPTKEDEMISLQLDQIEKSIGELITSISNKPIQKQEQKLGKDEVAAIKHIPEEEVEAEIIKQRLAAIDKSIKNIEKAFAKSKADVGSNCGFEKVCTFYVCTKWGPPPIVSGGTAVCLESECRTWEDKFVCHK